jgi:flagellar M-ring protein FliF
MTDSSTPLARAARSMSGSRRFLLLGAAAIAVVAVWTVSRWASAPTYVTLYRDLELNEAGAVAENLAKNEIPHRLGAGGTEVLVPVSDIARARVTLAKEGLPLNGRPGLELFDKASWGMTDFTQRVTYQRALEGELARTIGGLRGIQRAQVHLVMPTVSPIRRLERPASASVVVTLKPGVTLAPDAVQGIGYIVSNSVEQLSSDNVAVMDDAGHVLSIPAADGTVAGMSTRQLEIQRSVEQYLGEKVEELLATVVGFGHARAQVSAQLSFDQVDRTTDTFDPEGQVIQTEQRSEGGGGGAQDAAGAQTIVSNAYQNSRRVEKIIGSVGGVTRLTVAVLVDEKSVLAGSPPGGRTSQLERIEAMVRNAVGADSSRGDRVSVMAVAFEPTAVAAAGAGTGSQEIRADPVQAVERLSRPLVGLVAIVALLLVSWLALRAAVATPSAAARPAGGAAEPGGAEPPGNGAAEHPAFRSRLKPDPNERPETAAQVVRAWLAESS